MKFKQLLTKINVLQENAPEHTFGGGLYIGDPQGRLGQSAAAFVKKHYENHCYQSAETAGKVC